MINDDNFLQSILFFYTLHVYIVLSSKEEHDEFLESYYYLKQKVHNLYNLSHNYLIWKMTEDECIKSIINYVI